MSIAMNYAEVKNRMEAACVRAGRDPKEVTLIAVSKTKPVSMLMEAYEAGARTFGENKVQEITEKFPQIPEDAKFHMIGHLQTNKVGQVIDKAVLIHSVDSVHLAEKIEKEAYETYWILNAEFKRRIEKLEYEVKNYLISQKQYNALITSTYNEFTQTDKRIAIKFNTFKELEETQEMIRLIKESIVKRNNVSYFPMKDKK